MAVTTDQLDNIINDIKQGVEQAYDGLSLFFITHRFGKMREAIALAEHEIISHRAARAAQSIIHKHTNTETSSFLGLATASEKKLMGLKKKDHILGLFNINIDAFNNEEQARAEIYHLTWHAIDLYEIYQRPQYKNKFRNSPMVPKRSDMNFAKASLQADVFAIALSVFKNEDSLLGLISSKRAHDAFKANHNHHPENFTSVIAMDACKLALKDSQYQDKNHEDGHFIIRARELSLDVGHAFNEDDILQWRNFTIPAQDMAWRDFSKEQILSAAINTSNDSFVRSIGHLIMEVTYIAPCPPVSLEKTYNAFIDPEVLSTLHKKMVDTIFEDAVTQGLQESSNRPFLNAANQLNEALTEGHILGWCSNALHDAAQAFDRALLNGSSPDQAARMQFKGNDKHPKWDTLKKLGKDIIDQKRKGFAVTMGHIAEVCHNNSAFAPVLGSLKITMNDPAYINQLKAVNDLNVTPNMPAPATFAPKAPAPKGPELAPNAPVPQAPAAAPTLGGNNRGAQITQQRNVMLQKQLKEQAQSDSGNHVED